jgi:hypothetical protein
MRKVTNSALIAASRLPLSDEERWVERKMRGS